MIVTCKCGCRMGKPKYGSRGRLLSPYIGGHHPASRNGFKKGNKDWINAIPSRKGKVPWNKGNNEYHRIVSKQLRDNIRARDGYKCQECGVLEKASYCQLDIHHIVPYELFESIEAHEESNLICLCRSCHLKLHMTTEKAKEMNKKSYIAKRINRGNKNDGRRKSKCNKRRS